MLTTTEAAAHLGIHEVTLVRWAEYGLVTKHAYNGHAWLYEISDTNLLAKHCSRWDRLANRSAVLKKRGIQYPQIQPKEVQYEEG
jgi:predicted site-specific integrase-resolvase